MCALNNIIKYFKHSKIIKKDKALLLYPHRQIRIHLFIQIKSKCLVFDRLNNIIVDNNRFLKYIKNNNYEY